MAKKILISTLLYFSTAIAFSQIKCDTILYEGKYGDHTPYYFISNGVHYEWKWNKQQKNYNIYKDTVPISTKAKGIDIQSYFFDKHNQVMYMGTTVYGTGTGRGFCGFDFKKDTLITTSLSYENAYKSVIANNKLYSAYESLYIRNLKDNKIIDSISMNKIDKRPYYGINRIIKFPYMSEIILMIGYMYYADEISDVQYYVYDEISKNISVLANNDIVNTYIDPNQNSIESYDISGKYLFWDNCIMSYTGDIFSKKLELPYSICGFVIGNEEIKQLICSSHLDSEDGKKRGNNVLIPFIPDPFKEKAMYEIYENIELKAQDLQRFDTFDLRLLRNMVFAKHNYAFKDKFLQAYFNLYSFYGYKKERLTDVNHLLTVADKKNLELIQQASKNKN